MRKGNRQLAKLWWSSRYFADFARVLAGRHMQHTDTQTGVSGDGDEEEEGGKSEEADAPQESEPEEENIADPLVAAKRAKQLAKHGIVFQAKVDPKVCSAVTYQVTPSVFPRGNPQP